jgi:hypothetical protein
MNFLGSMILIVEVPIHSNKAGLCYRKGEKGDRTGKVKKGNAKTYKESKKQKCKIKNSKLKKSKVCFSESQNELTFSLSGNTSPNISNYLSKSNRITY